MFKIRESDDSPEGLGETEMSDHEHLRLLTPKECDVIIREFNEQFLTPDERDRIVREHTTNHILGRTDFETDEKTMTSQNKHVDPKREPDHPHKRLRGEAAYGVNVGVPEVRGVKIESIDQLKKIIGCDFPGLSDRKDLHELLRTAEIHLELLQEYRNRDSFSRKETLRLANKTGVSHETIKAWLRNAITPRIYTMLRNALTAKEGRTKLEGLQRKLNGVTDLEEFDRRLGHFYLEEEVGRLPNHEEDRELARRFFHFMQALPNGGLLSDIARRAGVPEHEVSLRLRAPFIPRLIRIASSIPAETPELGKKWLPLKITKTRRLQRYVQVPLKITAFKDILSILERTRRLRSPELDYYEQHFGRMTKQLAFMYLLGIIVSDGAFGRAAGVSTSIWLSASKKYSWSKDFGRAFSYSLARIGIFSKQYEDNVQERENGRTSVIQVWRSASVPLLCWIRKTLLGLRTGTTKGKVGFQADWILQMPYSWRVAFLQGVSDGDGFASIKAFSAGICTLTNQEFLMRLLNSLGIEAFSVKSGVTVRKKEAIRRAGQLPMFRHAVARQSRLVELAAMFDSVTRKPASEEEINNIMVLHNQGFSSGQITMKLWREHGIARRPGVIRKIIGRTGKKRNARK